MNRFITRNCDSEKYENNINQNPSISGMKPRKIPKFLDSSLYE